MTLGELIIEERGKITGQRALDVKISKVETSLILEGNCRGTPFMEVRTVISVREGDALYGEGQGIITTKDDKERANWTAQGIGKVTGLGKTSWDGSILLRASEGQKLSYLNNMVGVYEYEMDEMGNI